MRKYVQYGFNPSWPLEIETWSYGEKVPEWLSDEAKVLFIDGSGNITLETRELNTGGFEIMKSSGSEVLVKLINKTDLVAYDLKTSRIFPITKKQLELLYD